MSTDLVATFEAELAAHDVTWTRTNADGFEDALTGAVSDPVVGAALPFEGVSLPESVVTHPTPEALRGASTGVTPAGLGIAEYGTVVVESRPEGDEPVSLYPERHVAVLRESDLVAGMSGAIERLESSISAGASAVLTTGPSATGDMGALVQGVHGPHEVHVILLEDR